MRGWIFWGWLLVVIVGAVGVARRVGQRLPAEHRAQASGVVAATPGRVWEMLTDPLAQNEWRTGVRRVQNQSFQTSEGMTCWSVWWAGMAVPLCVAEEQPEVRRVLVTHAWNPMPFQGRWTYELTPVAGGTRVTITEDMTLGPPLWRFYGRYGLRGRTEVRQELQDMQAEGPRRR